MNQESVKILTWCIPFEWVNVYKSTHKVCKDIQNKLWNCVALQYTWARRELTSNVVLSLQRVVRNQNDRLSCPLKLLL